MFFAKYLTFAWLISFYESYFKPIPPSHGSIDFSFYNGLHKEPCPMPVSKKKRCGTPGNVLCLVDCKTSTGGHVDAEKKLCLEHAVESAVFKMISHLPRPADRLREIRARLGKEAYMILAKKFAETIGLRIEDEPMKFISFVATIEAEAVSAMKGETKNVFRSN